MAEQGYAACTRKSRVQGVSKHLVTYLEMGKGKMEFDAISLLSNLH